MAVTVAFSISGGTAAERSQLVDAILTRHPQPPDWTGTRAEWAKEAVIQDIEDMLNDALVNAAANAAAQEARANRINLVRG
jgi:hypothetical protein